MSDNLPTVPAQPKVVKLVTTDGQNLPVVEKPAHRPVRALKKFAGQCDDLQDTDRGMEKARKNVLYATKHPNSTDAQKYLDDATAALKRYDDYGTCELVEELKLAMEQFSPESAYDDDGQLTEEVVRKHIALLLASFPNAAPGDPEAYVGMMIEHVMAEEDVSLIELESACSAVRATSKFPPSISEVIEAIQEQLELWGPRYGAIHGMRSTVKQVRDGLKIATEAVAAYRSEQDERRRVAAERKRIDDELRAQPLAVGDRVRSGSGSNGTIVSKPSYDEAGSTVFFDNGSEAWVLNEDLKRLIPGDAGFQIPERDRQYVEKLVALSREKQERNKPPVVGDRVRSSTGGAGTVLAVADLENHHGLVSQIYTVQCDSGLLRENVPAGALQRLLPGDFDFVPGPKTSDQPFDQYDGDGSDEDLELGIFGYGWGMDGERL